MSEHMLVYVDRVMRPVLAEPSSLTVKEDNAVYVYDGDTFATEMWSAECRICQEESAIMNLESPCACNGSLKCAHRKCVQRWCNEKGNTICEICNQSYQAGYTSPPPPLRSEETTIDIGGRWTISGLDLDDPHLMAIAEAERQILESEYDDHTAPDTSLAAFFRISALILMTLLLRCALTIPDYADGEDEDTSSILSLFLLRAATFLLPCYIMASAISILHRRRQRQVSFLDTLATKLFLSFRHRTFFLVSKKVNLRYHVFFSISQFFFLLISKYLRNRIAIPQSYQSEPMVYFKQKLIEQEAVALATRFALVLSSRQPRAMINYLSMEP